MDDQCMLRSFHSSAERGANGSKKTPAHELDDGLVNTTLQAHEPSKVAVDFYKQPQLNKSQD